MSSQKVSRKHNINVFCHDIFYWFLVEIACNSLVILIFFTYVLYDDPVLLKIFALICGILFYVILKLLTYRLFANNRLATILALKWVDEIEFSMLIASSIAPFACKNLFSIFAFESNLIFRSLNSVLTVIFFSSEFCLFYCTLFLIVLFLHIIWHSVTNCMLAASSSCLWWND